jgi:DNA-directed RNA polymerase specialized sigma24 family protein
LAKGVGPNPPRPSPSLRACHTTDDTINLFIAVRARNPPPNFVRRQKMDPNLSVTYWIDQLKAGEQQAAQALWERYVQQLARLARKKLHGGSRAVADEEDVVVSAFKSFCRRAEEGRFPQLHDRNDLWKLLVVITERKALTQVRDQRRHRRGGGQVQGESALAGATSSAAAGLDNVAGREPTPAFAAQVAEECQVLLDLLGDETLRRIAVARMEGDTNEEIASRLDVSLRTVERKLELIRRIWESRMEE